MRNKLTASLVECVKCFFLPQQTRRKIYIIASEALQVNLHFITLEI